MRVVTDWEPQWVRCPKCRKRMLDYDGFGCVRHEECGYCAHGSVDDGGRCRICGELLEDVAEACWCNR